MTEPRVSQNAPEFSLKSTSGEASSRREYFLVEKGGAPQWKHVESDTKSPSNAEFLVEMDRARD
jgi:hypothetical protein